MKNDRSADIHDYLTLLERVPEMFRRSMDAIAIYDLDGRIVAGNAVARAIVGPDRAAELLGQHYTAHLTMDAATRAARDFAHCVTLGEVIEGETVFIDAESKPFPVRMRLIPARVDRTIVGVIGIARDGRRRRSIQEQFMRAEQQFRSLFENHPDALSLHDLEGRFVRVNAACETLTGYSVEELIGQTPDLLKISAWNGDPRVRESVARGEGILFGTSLTTKGGVVREIDGRRVPLHEDGRVRGFCAIVRDVTETRRAARSSERQADRIAELYHIAAANVGTDDKIANALETGLHELGARWAYVARLDAAGEDWEIAVDAGTPPEPRGPVTTLGTDPASLRAACDRLEPFALAAGPAGERSIVGAPLVADLRCYGVLAFVQEPAAIPLAPTDRDYLHALGTLVASAMQQSEREKRLDSLAFGDSLTGLPNRALLQDRLEQTLLSARRHRRSFGAHYIDIDHFKAINDTFGHHVGDAVLVAVAGWLRSALRDSDTIGRIGGDEFVVLQPEIDSQSQAEDLAAKLVAICDNTFRIGSRDITVTISVGCAIFPVDAENPVDMLRAADAALYEVKHRGRNGYAVGHIL